MNQEKLQEQIDALQVQITEMRDELQRLNDEYSKLYLRRRDGALPRLQELDGKMQGLSRKGFDLSRRRDQYLRQLSAITELRIHGAEVV